MKRTTWILIIGLVIVLGGGLMYYRSHHGNQGESQQSRTIKVEQGNVTETVDSTGDVVPLNRVEIKPPVSGRLEKIVVDEGNPVKSGQILAWMSSTERAAIIDSATAMGLEERKRWEESYKPAPILSPISGLVILNNVVPGQTVDTSTVLFALSDQLIVLAEVDEVDISRVHLGMKAQITLDAYPNQRISGKVIAILYEGKNVSNVITYGVKIVPERVPPFFRSQMTANVSLVVNQKENVLLVPIQAIQVKPNGDKFVLLSNPEGGRPQPREVQTGVENGAQVEIVSGLKLDDEIVMQHARYRAQTANTANSPLTMGAPRGGGGGAHGGGGR
jgi:macrolide-specific efflux system membrane fusion protein